MFVAVGSQQLAVGSQQLAVGSWQSAVSQSVSLSVYSSLLSSEYPNISISQYLNIPISPSSLKPLRSKQYLIPNSQFQFLPAHSVPQLLEIQELIWLYKNLKPPIGGWGYKKPPVETEGLNQNQLLMRKFL